METRKGLVPRICIDCLLKTTRVICPRCGGQTDIDETSDYYCPEMRIDK